MVKKYSAICGDGDRSNLSKDGFLTKEAAEQYITDNFCDSCKVNSDDPKDAPCRAEWHVKEYEG